MNKKHRILIIDDDVEMADLMGKLLEQENYEVDVAHDGLRAIEKSNQENFDLILLDIRMPFFSGFWFCDAFKQRPQTKNVPVVMVSGLSADENVEKAMVVGATDYLKKPFQADELIRVVQKYLPLSQAS